MTREVELIGKLRLIAKDCHWQLLEDAADTIDELRRDAARYRWLRKVAPNMFWDNHDKKIGFVKFDTKAHLWEPEVFDQAIDAAIKESK